MRGQDDQGLPLGYMKRLSRYLLVVLPLFFIGAIVYSGLFDQQEMTAYDWLLRTRPIQATHPQIAIIEIADDTLKALGRWPLPRDFHAELIDALTESGCRMIAFDIMFSEPGPSDDVLSAAMRNSKTVYLPVAFDIGEKVSVKNGCVAASKVLGGVAKTFKGSVAGIGQINTIVDPDGKVRRVPVLINYGKTQWPSLGLLVAAGHMGLSADEIRLKIPVDQYGNMLVNYPGPWTKTFVPRYSYKDIINAARARHGGASSSLDLSVFKDKICFVGLTATGTSDIRANPIDPRYPMIGTQASVCDSILRNAFIKRLPALFRFIIDAAIVAMIFIGCCALAPVAAFGLCVLAAGVYLAAAWSIFAYQGVFIDVFLPLACIAIVYAAVLLRKFFEEAQKRRVLEKELEIAASIQRSFLPPDVRQINSIQIRAFLKPARYVGGDLYDIIYLDDNAFGVFIGDVSGKGVSAALIMAQTISLLRVLARNSRDPGEVLKSLNNQLKPFLNGRFVTGQYLVVHAKEGYWEGACAGHPALLLMNSKRNHLEELLPASGPPLGLVENMTYSTEKSLLNAGDKIFMYTDGWTEARDASGKEFGLGLLKEIALNDCHRGIDVFLFDLQVLHDEFEGAGNQYDDLTAVALEIPG
jgi:adenylate cyclase